MSKYGILSTLFFVVLLLPDVSKAAPSKAVLCQQADGTLIYRSSGACPRATRKINLTETLRGETGPTGPTGPTGATGATGPAPATVASFSGRTDNSVFDGDFIPVVGIQPPTNVEFDRVMALPAICAHVTKMTASMPAVPGAGTWTFTLRRDFADTGLSCSMSDATTLCSGSGSIANTTPGSTLFVVRAVATAGTPSPELVFVTIECD